MKKTFDQGEPLRLSATLKNEGSVYDAQIAAGIFEKNGSSSSVGITISPFFLDAGEEKSIELVYSKPLKEGTYIISLRYYTVKNGFNNLLTPNSYNNIEINVTGNQTGVEQSEATPTEDGFLIQSANGILIIDTNIDIKRWEIINLSGRILKSSQTSVVTSNQKTISIQDLASGIYLLRIYSEKGVYSKKVVW